MGGGEDAGLLHLWGRREESLRMNTFMDSALTIGLFYSGMERRQ